MKTKNIPTNRIGSMILSFPSEYQRSKFFETNCLEKYGISEKTMGTETDCVVDHLKVVDLIKVIAYAKKNFGANYYVSCAGRNLKDCGNYEKKCGNICDYCQYMEMG